MMLKKPKILVVGSFVMDQIATTDVFPKEGETVLGTGFSKAPGGKGANQAVQAGRLGAEVTMFGKLGRDANGEELLRTCREAAVNTELVLRDESAPSGCAVIILTRGEDGQTQNRILVLPGANGCISPREVEFLKDTVGEYNLVMLQLEIPMEINELLAGYAAAAHVPVMLNSAPAAPLSDAFLAHLTYLSPNEHEAAELTGVTIAHKGKQVALEDVKKAAGVLHKKGIRRVLVTLGEAGAALDTEEGFFYSPCVEGITAVDPTAAGDSFVGAFCVGCCCGWSPEEILRFANHTAALTVSAMGAMPSLPTLERVEEFMRLQKSAVPNTAPLKGEG